jgi:hypothetical protein
MGVKLTEGWPTSLKKQGVLFLTLQVDNITENVEEARSSILETLKILEKRVATG